jgi:putative membrane protein
MRLILHLLVIAAIAYILSQVLPGVHIKSYGTAVIFAIVLGLLNVFLRPLLILVTLPLTIFTFGLFIFVINTVMVMIAGEWIKNFQVDSFWHGLLFSLILSFTTSALFREERRQRNSDSRRA